MRMAAWRGPSWEPPCALLSCPAVAFPSGALTLVSLPIVALPVQTAASDAWTKAATAFNSTESSSAEVRLPCLLGLCLTTQRSPETRSCVHCAWLITGFGCDVCAGL